MQRISISTVDIINGNFKKDKKYFLKYEVQQNKTKLSRNETYNLRIAYQDIKSLDINLHVRSSIFLSALPFFKNIFGNISFKENLVIQECPLLKTLDCNIASGKSLYFRRNQHLTTILSEKQFDSFEDIYIFLDRDYKIKTYEEYYSLIEPTLIKNKLLNICNL